MDQLNTPEGDECSVDLRVLESHYLENGRDEFSKNCVSQKIIDILHFRMKYNRFYKFPERLFFVESEILSDTDDLIKCILQDRSKTPNSLPISFFLKQSFPNVQCIYDFFCYSTFPSMFGHFTSQEYIADAYHFIKQNLDDTHISPFLICSFFLHSTVFQDRLMSIFYINFINIMQKRDQNIDFQNCTDIDFKVIFINSFRNCLSYLSEFHFLLVSEFKKKYPEHALFTFSEIIRISLKLWKYSPFLENISISVNPNFIIDYSPVHQKCLYKDLVKNLKKNIEKKDIDIILSLFDDASFFYEYAKYQHTIYKNEINFTFTISDLEIISKLAKSLIQNKIQNSDMTVDQFIENSTIIKQGEGYHEFNTPVLIQLTKMSSNQYHQHLSQISGELTKLHFCTVSSTKILRLTYYQFSEKFLLQNQIFKPGLFLQSQICLYGQEYFEKCLKKANIQINQEKPFDINISSIIGPDFKTRKSNTLLIKNFIEFIYSKLNIIIQNYNDKNQKAIKLFSSSNPSIIKKVSIFVSSVDNISWYLLLLKLSQKEISFIQNTNFQSIQKNDNNKKMEIMKYMLLDHVNKFGQSELAEIEEIEGDLLSQIEFFSEICGLIDISNEEMKIEFDEDRGMFNFGKKIRLFMKIHESIERSIQKTNFEDEKYQKFIYYFLYIGFYKKPKPVDYMEMLIDHCYFKLNLMIALFVIEKIISNPNSKYLPLKIFETENRLKKLLNFFNMKDTISPTEPMTRISFDDIIQ